MDSLQFRQVDSIADWQIMLLSLLCLVLILLWYGIKRYTNGLGTASATEQPLSKRYKLASGQVLHKISFQGQEYVVLESRFGMTQLSVKDVAVEP
jgi:hypothetical protein